MASLPLTVFQAGGCLLKLGDSKVHADLRKLKSISTLRKTDVFGLGRNGSDRRENKKGGKREGARNREIRR